MVEKVRFIMYVVCRGETCKFQQCCMECVVVEKVSFSIDVKYRCPKLKFRHGWTVLLSKEKSVSACLDHVMVEIVNFSMAVMCVVVKNLGFSMAGLCPGRNSQFQHGCDVSWSKQSVWKVS